MNEQPQPPQMPYQPAPPQGPPTPPQQYGQSQQQLTPPQPMPPGVQPPMPGQVPPMQQNYSSGSLTVPACGAGTANTEFEMMTGLSVKFFGPGEYPFKSILREKTMESVSTDLKSIGYRAHAIHNHRGVFYNRNEVFDNMGYDTFTSLEYMSDVEKTPKNWGAEIGRASCRERV